MNETKCNYNLHALKRQLHTVFSHFGHDLDHNTNNSPLLHLMFADFPFTAEVKASESPCSPAGHGPAYSKSGNC